MSRYTVTAALPYANGPIHIGQLAGAYIAPDIFVRYKRMQNEDVIFICGSDEHGVAITLQALKQNTTPQAIVDKYHELNKESFARFGISFDYYHRTSAPLHHETAAGFFKTLNDKGAFTEEEKDQFYDEDARLFLADRYIIGRCPNCGNENAYGDQCEKCGSTLSPQDLINPRSALSGKAPVLRKTKHWYLPLDRYEPWLKEWIIEGHRDDWKRNVYGQCKSWIESGLKPRAMTRDLDWGVKIPLAGTEGKVLYVWLDAPIGYISSTKAWAAETGGDWRPYWQDETTKLIHFIGKDNIVFHCIIFPVILKAHGGYILPDNVPANEFMNMEGQKISTSRNWAVWLHEYLDENPGKEDVLRYVLTANMPETKDSEFTWKDFQDRNNSELVAVFGNLVNRVVVLIGKFFDGKVPPAPTGNDPEWLGVVSNQKRLVTEALDTYRFREALDAFMEIARYGNRYLTEREPWQRIKTDQAHAAETLHVCAQLVANLSLAAEPFLPFTASRLRELLALRDMPLTWANIGGSNLLPVGHQLGKPTYLFEKIEDDFVSRQIERLYLNAATKA
jgi:methionyl-tRNA synthetase